VTQRKQAEIRIEHMARHDALTDLANVPSSGRRRGGAHPDGPAGALAVHCIDLDQFKAVNDTLGHPAGDALLCAVAERLRTCVRDGDTVARLGGDEFAVLQLGMQRPEEAGALARRIIEAASRPYEIEGQQVTIGASIGVAVAPGDGANPDQLLKHADLALYRAKADGRGTFRFFEPEMDSRLRARRALELDLRRALAQDEFELFYQPLVDLRTDRVSGCEALLRWHHPVRGLVPPAEFIGLAEETGLIVPLGEWVLRQACIEAARWPREIKVAVNLSPAQFKSRNLVNAVIRGPGRVGAARHTARARDHRDRAAARERGDARHPASAARLGVRISMDDFGPAIPR
jgi:diguanylate cyclase (GGDEF)-like protein